MASLNELLQRGRNGRALLFCGAGLTADCLNFGDDAPLGVTYHLLRLLNEELRNQGKRSGFNDIKNAAQVFRRELGSFSMMNIIKDRFALRDVSQSILDIVKFPWATIYTTNYDNGLEIAFQRSGKLFTSINNTDDPRQTTKGTPIIHLHGSAQHWTGTIFENSCILDSNSYHNLPGVKNWLARLRTDIEKSQVVIFIGFSAADFHLSNVLFNYSEIKRKSFFINHQSSEIDLDMNTAQSDFGTPLYIGRQDFAQIISYALLQDIPAEPKLASFVRHEPVVSSSSVPPVHDIEDLFIWGKLNEAHIKRDCERNVSDYHLLRYETADIKNRLSNPGVILLVHGDICEGKSIIITDVINLLSRSRPVYVINHIYLDLLDEVASILSIYPDTLLVIENCFSLREEHLASIVRQVSGSSANLLLSARNVSTDGETGKLKSLHNVASFSEISVSKIVPDEVEPLMALIDQIAGWHGLAGTSPTARRRFIEIECRYIIPNLLLRILDSDHVRNRYKQEYNKIYYLNETEHQAVIAALLISNIGIEASVSLLSNIFERDFLSIIRRLNTENTFRLLRVEGGKVYTVPSIGTRNLLKSVVDDRLIVNTTIYILEKLSYEIRRDDLQQHIFSQLMRFDNQ